ncbi:MAG: hypothetical protein PUG55_00550 [Bacillales bacterium]|nr:hypothetical protein [Bacillales bacterium]MDY6003302.1 hypothetical protein [Bacilli bacterium]
MKFRRLLFPIIGFLVLITSSAKPIANANNINHLKNEGNNIVLRMANSLDNLDDTEDPNEIFSRALNEYIEEFDSYLDITGLNVFDKEAITLPDFDINYVAPEYYTIMNDYETSFQSGMSSADLIKYNNFRQNNAYFDKHITLIETKYLNLNIRPKFNPNLDIKFPLIEHSRSLGLMAILTSAGLSEAIISAFAGCATALSSALSSAWIPIIGWAIAVGVVVGALIALTVIIVENWNAICKVIDDIKAWFLEEFSMFTEWINSFFSDAVSKGEESLISSRATIGDKTFEFQQVQANDYAKSIAIAQTGRRNYDVFLMQYVKSSSFEIALGMPVSKEFCISNKTHLLGFSSYTWYQNSARELILKAGTGYTSPSPELHLYNEGTNTAPKFAFKHFHNYTASGVRDESLLAKRTHSFFGLLYWTPNNDGIGEIHPESPKY